MSNLNKDQAINESFFECEREGLKIRGHEYRPAGDHLPIAIVSHGFMAFQDTVKQYAIALAKMGYVSYCFDFCGGCVIKGKSEGKTTDMSVLTETRDLEAVIAYARSRAYTQSSRVLLMGCSQGGFVSALVAAKQEQNISQLILFYPAFCIPDDARAGKMMFAKFDPHHIPNKLWCGPMRLGKCYVEDVIEMDPFDEIKTYTGDVLIVHGDHDAIVDLKYAYQAYETYLQNQSSQRRVELKIIENGKHGFKKESEQIAIETLQNFLHT